MRIFSWVMVLLNRGAERRAFKDAKVEQQSECLEIERVKQELLKVPMKEARKLAQVSGLDEGQEIFLKELFAAKGNPSFANGNRAENLRWLAGETQQHLQSLYSGINPEGFSDRIQNLTESVSIDRKDKEIVICSQGGRGVKLLAEDVGKVKTFYSGGRDGPTPPVLEHCPEWKYSGTISGEILEPEVAQELVSKILECRRSLDAPGHIKKAVVRLMQEREKVEAEKLAKLAAAESAAAQENARQEKLREQRSKFLG